MGFLDNLLMFVFVAMTAAILAVIILAVIIIVALGSLLISRLHLEDELKKFERERGRDMRKVLQLLRVASGIIATLILAGIIISIDKVAAMTRTPWRT